ncbi:hypothetical protein [Paenibacillus methanolicus]|uniref:Uncharacterized protein n=1 Tax=Paenibacillus methanolicus TaxID=582686 RepID=A0A5S5BXP4_9BACL|nr:hypothetical protein [Paenibacillus methanolicus]TYP71729.1 hypothetical protein BCM02_1097 [Paenibacillus methanolicus]
MDYVLFVIGATIEYFSLFIFMLTLFRFRIKKRIVHAALVSLLMSQVSYFTRIDPDIGSMSSFLQIALSIVVLCIIFRTPIRWSVVMNFASAIFGFAVQGILLLVLWFGMGLTLETVQSDRLTGAAAQIASSVLFLAASRTVVTFNLGFNYVPIDVRSYERVTRSSAIIISSVSVAMVAACITAYMFRNDVQDYFFIALGIFVLTLPLFLYYSFRKDEEDVR